MILSLVGQNLALNYSNQEKKTELTPRENNISQVLVGAGFGITVTF